MVLLVALGCGEAEPLTAAEIASVSYLSLDRFGSDFAYKQYLARLRLARRRQESALPGSIPLAGQTPGLRFEDLDPRALQSAEEVDNAGRLWQRRGSQLLLLQRNRLFSLDLGDAANPRLELLASVSAHPPGGPETLRYEELLVRGEQVILVGYDFEAQALTLTLFRCDAAGQWSHRASYQLRAFAYRPPRVALSRLLDRFLVLYVPVHLVGGENAGDLIESLPVLGELKEGKVSGWRNLIKRGDIRRPVMGSLDPVLHTMLRCDLESEDFKCESRTLLAPATKLAYASRTALYFLSDPAEAGSYSCAEPKSYPYTQLYRFPIDDAEPGVVALEGLPADSFAVHEEANRVYALLRRRAPSASCPAAAQEYEARLARIPLDSFSLKPNALGEMGYDLLNESAPEALTSRFVEGSLLFAAQTPDAASPLQSYPYPEGGMLRALPNESVVEALLPFAGRALLVGRNDATLQAALWPLDAAAASSKVDLPLAEYDDAPVFAWANRAAAMPEGLALAGLALLRPEDQVPEQGSAEVRWLGARGGELELLATTRAMPTFAQDSCGPHCFPWFANLRVFFDDGRIFATLGYEVVELALQGDDLVELRRLALPAQ